MNSFVNASQFEEKNRHLFLKQVASMEGVAIPAEGKLFLQKLAATLSELTEDEWTPPVIKHTVERSIYSNNEEAPPDGKTLGKCWRYLRGAIAGGREGAGVVDMVWILKREEVLNRLKLAL